jgi:alpha-L-rhamnosidase
MCTAFLIIMLIGSCKEPSTGIINLRVQMLVEPLAIEDLNPEFSWQMISDISGMKQNAYQIIVKKAIDGSMVWDSKKVENGISNHIAYAGTALEPETAYTWDLTVWDAQDKMYYKTSRFETGLMNPDISAWNGAKWIGSSQPILDAASDILFEIITNVRIEEGSKAASVVFGANDFRLNNKFQNIENASGQNYVQVEMDISGVGSDKGAALNIYRVGYDRNDSKDVPFMVISKENYPQTNLNEIITSANMNAVHNLSIYVSSSSITIQIDNTPVIYSPPLSSSSGSRGGSASIRISNGITGNNYNTYPNLNSIGFASRPNDRATFTGYRILNKGKSAPEYNEVFGANTGSTYAIFDGLKGVSVDNGVIIVSNNSREALVSYADPSFGSLTMLRTCFKTKAGKSIIKAKLYVTSMGANEFYINGSRVGNDWFGPGDSQFRETLCYLAYDVTDMVNKGENSMGALLSPGWYSDYMTYITDNFNFFGDHQGLLAKLVITYSDGTKEAIVTDPSTWKVYKNGPVEYGSFFQGERYNAGKEANVSVKDDVNGWATAAYDDSQWSTAEIISPRNWIHFNIVTRYDQPVQVVQILEAQQVIATHSEDEHTFTYNMGVNMTGVPSVTIPKGWLQAGDTIILRYAEQLYPGFPGDKQEYIDLNGYNGTGRNIAGRILTENYRGALATDFYTAKGSDKVVIQPRTTYRGYQYIQITLPGHKGALPLTNVKGLVLSSDRMPTGTYIATTNDNDKTGKLVNQLFRNIQRSQLGNFFTIPTDCPQRNERMGWTGDAQVYTRTGTYNSDVRNFFRQWMVALRDDQGIGSDTDVAGGIGSTVPTFNTSDITNFPDGTTWSAAVCMVPWQLFIQYGDKQIIVENIESMMSWLNGMDHYDFSKEHPYLSAKATGSADWLAMDSHTPADLLNNSIYIYMMEATAIMAHAIGRDDYADVLNKRHDLAKAEWNEVYVDPVSGKTKNSDGLIIHSQSSYATPLNFNAFSDINKKKAEEYLAELAANPSSSNTNMDGTYVKYPAQEETANANLNTVSVANDSFKPYTITTGFSGTPNILPALSRAGKVDAAYRMFTCTDFTSWLYPVTMGATSIWERWDGYEAAFKSRNQNMMNSFNHFALGAVGQWMYEFQLGITTDHMHGEAGYKNFVLQPQAGANFTSLNGSYQSEYGTITSSWTADGNGTMTSYTAGVPANTTATLYLPVISTITNQVTAEEIRFKGMTIRNGISVAQYELTSGRFQFNISDNEVTATIL